MDWRDILLHALVAAACALAAAWFWTEINTVWALWLSLWVCALTGIFFINREARQYEAKYHRASYFRDWSTQKRLEAFVPAALVVPVFLVSSYLMMVI